MHRSGGADSRLPAKPLIWQGPVGAGYQRGTAGAIYRAGFFAGKPAPTGAATQLSWDLLD
ncbi:hypothetical protein CQW32_21200 [Pseudomonas putida]|nr:hypothetical protein CQW32_21200 [Pseudomonas putida]